MKTVEEVVKFLDSELKVHQDIEIEMHAKGDYSADKFRKDVMNTLLMVRYEVTGEKYNDTI
jgi:hypothetical protein